MEQTLALVKGKCAIYARLNDQNSRFNLYVASKLNARLPRSIKAQGRIYYDVLMNGEDTPVVFEDLNITPYSKKDPLIRRFRFRSSIGCPVSVGNTPLGSLCVMDTRKRFFTPFEKYSIVAFARAIGLEEERRQIQEAFDKRISCEKMLVDVSRKAISIDDVEALLRWCVKRMDSTLDTDGIFIWRYDPVSNSLSNISEWVAKGHPRQRDKFQQVLASAFPWAMKALRRNRIIKYRNMEEMPTKRERKILGRIGIKSILIIPLFVRSAFYGAIGFEAYRQKREWLESDIYVLRTVSQIISRAIENFEFEKALERINNELEHRVVSRTERLNDAARRLEEKQKELMEQKIELEKVNNALSKINKALFIFAKNAKRGREDLINSFGRSLREKILPVVEKLRREEVSSVVRADLEVFYMHLWELIKGYPTGRNFSSKFTPVEARVAAMIKNGLTNQDIARELKVSVETVKTHRRNIREKLEIKNKKINLRTFLEFRWCEN